MRFYEFESKQLFGKHGIPLPKGSRVAHSREEASAIAAEIGGPVVLKSQVLTRRPHEGRRRAVRRHARPRPPRRPRRSSP